MQRSPFWEADSNSANQEIPSFMESEDSLPCSQEPATGPYPESHKPSSYPHTPFI
jgi:hypothetical protein